MLESVAMKRFSLTLPDFLVAFVLAVVAWNHGAVAVLLAVIGFLLYLLVRYQLSPATGATAPTEDNEFVVELKDDEQCSVDLDVNFNYRQAANHFLVQNRFDTYRGKSSYEYRVDGQDVFCRLMEKESYDWGTTTHDVRDGVVQEAEIRERDKDKNWSWFNVDENISKLKQQTEWRKMEALDWHGLKYFILSKKLPRPDARRYLRQELERFKVGTARFFKEAEKYGSLEPDENSLDRFRVADGKPRPSAEEMKRLNASCDLKIAERPSVSSTARASSREGETQSSI